MATDTRHITKQTKVYDYINYNTFKLDNIIIVLIEWLVRKNCMYMYSSGNLNSNLVHVLTCMGTCTQHCYYTMDYIHVSDLLAQCSEIKQLLLHI